METSRACFGISNLNGGEFEFWDLCEIYVYIFTCLTCQESMTINEITLK